VQSSILAYLTILAITALLSQWLLETVQSALQQDTANGHQGPVMYIDDFLATRMDNLGVRQYTLAAPHLVELPNQQGTRVEHPVMNVFKAGQIRDWIIRAENGWMSANNDLIKLQQQVSLVRPAADGKQPIVITTRDVAVRPNEGFAETAAAVRAETPNGVLEGVGLKAYFREEKIRLLSQVRGSYVPPKP
jgi:lipopolysaccharide export system protein LptC